MAKDGAVLSYNEQKQMRRERCGTLGSIAFLVWGMDFDFSLVYATRLKRLVDSNDCVWYEMGWKIDEEDWFALSALYLSASFKHL